MSNMESITLNQVENLDIILVHTKKGLLPELIQEFQGNDYNHAMIALWLCSELYMSEATEHGPALTDFMKEYYHNDKYDLLVLKPDFNIHIERYRNRMVHWLLSNTGHSEYDYANLLIHQPIKFLSKKILKRELWIGRKGKLAEKIFICGEWVAFPYYLYCHIFMTLIDKIAPADIYNHPDFRHCKLL